MTMKINFIWVLFCALSFTFSAKAQKSSPQKTIQQQLLEEGWHRKEIDRLMQDFVSQNSGIPSKKDMHGVPMPKPNLLRDIVNVHQWADDYRDEYKKFEKDFSSSRESSKIISADTVLPNRKIERQNGLWKHIDMYASSGRIYDLELDPNNVDLMYANPDGDGIFKTIDGGLSWEAITDNIPDRIHRNSYENIIVDPLNFKHLFSISRFGMMFETVDAGANWLEVRNEDHKEGRVPQFKWVEAFRNANDSLILIGTVTKKSGINHGWNQGVYRSADKGRSWTHLAVDGSKFQELAFHQSNKNAIYLGNTSKIYKSINSGITFELLHDFEYGDRPMFISTLSGEDADGLYIVVSKGDNTQVHFSSNQGETWELRQDSENKIGYEKAIFGDYGSSGWTSFFAVDPFDKNHLLASNVASCESFDGGVTWEKQEWYTRALAQMPNGTRPLAPYGSHNADNHVVKFHPLLKGLMVKGCDAGIMKKELGDKNWININGNMPAVLWYSVVVNEFGDRYISGNTQDVNIQTYRYNTWENDRGYEGDAIFLNPATNTTYFPTAKTEEGEGIDFLEPGFWKMHSWSMPKVAVNYKNLDQVYVAFGRRPTEQEPQLPKFLYVSNNRGVSFKRLPNMEDKEVFSVNVSRTAQPVLTAFTDSSVMTTIDEGKSWQIKKYPLEFKGTQRNRKVSGCVDPNNPQRMWVGGDHGDVLQSDDGGETWISIKGCLPNGHVLELLHHEGTASDLYALIKGYGVFYRGSENSDWEMWMDGFNLTDFSEIRIDYPTQKLLASSYGRGLWEADLEQTVDRFFIKGVNIVSMGSVNGKSVFKINTDLQIPAYYNYIWTVNNKRVEANKLLLTNDVESGDVIKVELSPIYSTDVIVSSSYVVSEITNRKIAKTKKSSAFYKDHFIDMKSVDLFGANQNFTFSTWIKPITEGVIAANRRSFYRDAKGWYLEVTPEGQLHFNAAFYQNRSLEKTFNKGVDQAISLRSKKGAVIFNKWAHIAISVDRVNGISLFLNGKKIETYSLDEISSSLSLNSVFNFTLLADSYGKRRMIGEIRDVAIHSKALNLTDVKRMVKKGNYLAENLGFYINFQSSDKNQIKELLTGKEIKLKGDDYLNNHRKLEDI
jgi:photosystem II stability/assembly factor-like uncharacterized protein